MRLKAFWRLQERWKILNGASRDVNKTLKTAYSLEHWKKGALFRSRYPNQVNSIAIQKCTKTTVSFPGEGSPSVPLQDDLQTLKNPGGEPRRSHLANTKRGQIFKGVYKVHVATGAFLGSGTFDTISISLVGSKGESPKMLLNNTGKDFIPGAVDEYDISNEEDLGDFLMVRLHKDPYLFFPEDSWYCSFVQITTPQGETYHFPCYQWMEGYRTLELREGTAKLICDDAGSPLLLQHRSEELKSRQEAYRWDVFAPGMPRCLEVESLEEMDTNSKFNFTKISGFLLKSKLTTLELKLKGFMNRTESWKKLSDMRNIFWFNKTPVSEYVAEHWEEDTFFGYQYLNGVNPVVIEKCKEIPSNFPVTQEMVAGSLAESTTLQEEVQKGNIFIVDYEILQGIPTNTIEGERQYLAVPLCLFYQTPTRDLIPIAIQLSQTPGPESPIFLPSDSKWDWILAKMWVRNADFHVHQNISHLLRTHLMAEIFSMAALRQLPMCHPLFKLLIPHLRYTLQINTLARVRLIKEGGMMDRATSAGFEGIVPLVAKGASRLTYSSLCLPEDIEARGVSAVANYYYRDDATKIWAAIEIFVRDMVRYYYWSDDRVQNDPELQAWIQEVFREGFQSRENSGAPSSLQTMEELSKFLTMVIFTCSAQHAAVNSGQFDFGSWIPNVPPTMRKPPPTKKGTATLENILNILPPVNITCLALTSLWLLSNEVGDRRLLGNFPDEHFSESEPKRLIRVFQSRLAEISHGIDERNKSLALPYEYINPPRVENSIQI
ncbi:polyunsaturated fatty acid lipoxygenase ALOX15B isoform X2 [Anolis carolinensis]